MIFCFKAFESIKRRRNDCKVGIVEVVSWWLVTADPGNDADAAAKCAAGRVLEARYGEGVAEASEKRRQREKQKRTYTLFSIICESHRREWIYGKQIWDSLIRALRLVKNERVHRPIHVSKKKKKRANFHTE